MYRRLTHKEQEHYLAMKMVYYPSEELNDFQPAGFSHFAEALDPDKDAEDIADMEIGTLRTAHHSLCVRYCSDYRLEESPYFQVILFGGSFRMKHRSIGKSRVSRTSPYPPQRTKTAKNQTTDLNKLVGLGMHKNDQSHYIDVLQRQHEDENMMVCR